MAITIPPFGIFIESKFKKEKELLGSVLSHERNHWRQFQRMGLEAFYFNYFVAFAKYGRGSGNWMEKETKKEFRKRMN